MSGTGWTIVTSKGGRDRDCVNFVPVISYRPTPRAVCLAAVAIMLVGVVILVLPCGRNDQPLDGRTSDLLVEVQQFALTMSADSGYARPTSVERTAIGDGVGWLLDNRPNEAAEVLSKVGYAVREQTDTGTRRTFYEISDTATTPRGWGRIMVDPAATSTRLGIEIPYPDDDQDSESLGVQLFRRVPGSILVIAGAHRRAASDRQADMAHTTDSVFEEVHALLVDRHIPVMQLHGFQNVIAPDSDVLVSAGPQLRNPYVEAIAQRLESVGLSVCRPWIAGCPGLEATTNVQAWWSDEHGADFAHIEVSSTLRGTASYRGLVVAALAAQAASR